MVYDKLRKSPMTRDLDDRIQRSQEMHRIARLELLQAAWLLIEQSQYGEGFPAHQIRATRRGGFATIKRHSVIIQEEP